MNEIHEIRQTQHHSKLAIFAIIGFLIVMVFVVFTLSKASQSERAYTSQSKASETDLQRLDGLDNVQMGTQVSQFSKEYSEIRSNPISPEDVGISQEILEQNMQTSPQGCRYAVFPGEHGKAIEHGPIECREKCTPEEAAQGKCNPNACYINAVVVCFNVGIQTYELWGGACRSNEEWNDIAQGLCCDYKEWARSAGWGDGAKDICDAICQRSEGKNCELDNSGRNPYWQCPIVPGSGGGSGGGQTLPIDPIPAVF